MNIAITGGSGFIGKRLIKHFLKEGHSVTCISRHPHKIKEIKTISWEHFLSKEDAKNIDTIIHLAGESLFGLWTKNKRKKIYDSRVILTKKLIDSITRLNFPFLRKIIGASAIGYYGNRGDTILDENSTSGTDFIAKTVRDSEEALFSNANPEIQTVAIRIGLVLDGKEGFLPKILFPFKLGLGAIFGNGSQWMSWIHINDLINLFSYIVSNTDISGPVNGVSQNPVKHADFCKILAKKIKRPLLLNVPEPFLKYILKEMSSLILNSQRVISNKKLKVNFKYNDINSALDDIL